MYLNLTCLYGFHCKQICEAQAAVHIVKEKLESLIISYKKKLGMHNLEYIAVSGTTHLVEVCISENYTNGVSFCSLIPIQTFHIHISI